jgi:prephenate dehydrogenase
MTPRLAVVGVGLIGGSAGLAARGRGAAGHVVGVGPNRATLERAKERGAVDSFSTDLEGGVAGADLVLLAAPVPRILEQLRELAPLLKPGAVVTDAGSVKGEIARAGADALGPAFVPGHPMAGSERSGIDAANADLFDGATWALTPTPQSSPDAVETVRAFAAALGARPLMLDPDAHDRAVAVTSHLPHLLAYALAATAGRAAADGNPHLFDLAAGSFASGTRVAASSPDLWQGIALSNRDALLSALDACLGELGAMRAALEAGDADTLLAALRRGHEAKRDAPTR